VDVVRCVKHEQHSARTVVRSSSDCSRFITFLCVANQKRSSRFASLPREQCTHRSSLPPWDLAFLCDRVLWAFLCRASAETYSVANGWKRLHMPSHRHCLMATCFSLLFLSRLLLLLLLFSGVAWTSRQARVSISARQVNLVTHCRKLLSIVTPLEYVRLGYRNSSLPRLSLLPMFTNTLPSLSAFEVTAIQICLLLLLFSNPRYSK